MHWWATFFSWSIANYTQIGQMLLKYFEIIQWKSSLKEKQELSYFFSMYFQGGILT